MDYGEHLFENPKTHEIESTSLAGLYHIEKLDLNAPHLVRERAQRSRIYERLREGPVAISGDIEFVAGATALLREQLSNMMPEFPAPRSETL